MPKCNVSQEKKSYYKIFNYYIIIFLKYRIKSIFEIFVLIHKIFDMYNLQKHSLVF